MSLFQELPVSLLHCIMCRDIIFPRVKFGTKDGKRGGGGKAIFS